MKRTTTAIITALAAATLMVSSCKKNGPAAPAVKPAAKPSLEKLLASTPCKIKDKSGVFVAFKGNTMPGQECFALAPGNDPNFKGNKAFNIEAAEITIIAHSPAAQHPKTLAIVSLKAGADGTPCFDQSCFTPVAAETYTYDDVENKGWSYTFVTPSKQPSMSGPASSFIAVTTGEQSAANTLLPVFN